MGKNSTRDLNILREKNKSLQRKIEKLRKQFSKFKSRINECDGEVEDYHEEITAECCKANPNFEKKINPIKPLCAKCNGELTIVELAGRKIGKCQQCGYWRKISEKEKGG